MKSGKICSVGPLIYGQLNITLVEFETFHAGVQQAARKAAEQSTTAAGDAISNISRIANATAENIDNAFVC
jgi:hypothetical protein